jgi:hypothetical protein
MAYPTAIGCGCLLGAGGAAPVHAAQWSFQPVLSWATDYDSNRSLYPGVQGSEQAVLSADLQLQRSLENTQFTLDPHFDVRRYSDSIWGPGDDRSIAGAVSWSSERSKLNLNGSIANQTTLTTELIETGIIDTNTRRRTEMAGGELDLARTEEHLFFIQASYLGSSYSGPAHIQELLPGYRYESASLGERFIVSEHWTLSPGVFGDILHSDRAVASSHEAGAQVELAYAHSERLSFDVQIGESRRALYGSASSGTNVIASATRVYERGSVSLGYSRSLVPYGNGFLVQRQQINATFKYSLSPYVDCDLTALRVDNNQATVRLGVDRRFYDNAVAGLNWRLGETWTLRSEFSASWSPPVNSTRTEHNWRTALTMTWRPLPKIVSR